MINYFDPYDYDDQDSHSFHLDDDVDIDEKYQNLHNSNEDDMYGFHIVDEDENLDDDF